MPKAPVTPRKILSSSHALVGFADVASAGLQRRAVVRIRFARALDAEMDPSVLLTRWDFLLVLSFETTSPAPPQYPDSARNHLL